MVNISDALSWLVKAEPFSDSHDFTPVGVTLLTMLDFSRILEKQRGIIESVYVYIVNRGVLDEVCYWTVKMNNFPLYYTETFRAGRKDQIKVTVPASGSYQQAFRPGYIFNNSVSTVTIDVEFGTVNLLCTALFTLEGYKLKAGVTTI